MSNFLGVASNIEVLAVKVFGDGVSIKKWVMCVWLVTLVGSCCVDSLLWREGKNMSSIINLLCGEYKLAICSDQNVLNIFRLSECYHWLAMDNQYSTVNGVYLKCPIFVVLCS